MGMALTTMTVVVGSVFTMRPCGRADCTGRGHPERHLRVVVDVGRGDQTSEYTKEHDGRGLAQARHGADGCGRVEDEKALRVLVR